MYSTFQNRDSSPIWARYWATIWARTRKCSYIPSPFRPGLPVRVVACPVLSLITHSVIVWVYMYTLSQGRKSPISLENFKPESSGATVCVWLTRYGSSLQLNAQTRVRTDGQVETQHRCRQVSCKHIRHHARRAVLVLVIITARRQYVLRISAAAQFTAHIFLCHTHIIFAAKSVGYLPCTTISLTMQVACAEDKNNELRLATPAHSTHLGCGTGVVATCQDLVLHCQTASVTQMC